MLWHEEVGAWLDFSLESGRARDYFYPSNVAPLWTGAYDRGREEYYVNRVINYLDKVKVCSIHSVPLLLCTPLKLSIKERGRESMITPAPCSCLSYVLQTRPEIHENELE